MLPPANIRKMTLGERQRAGIGAVGPKHPKMREYIRNMGSTMKSQEPESDDEPMESDAAEEEGAPGLRGADCCGNCTHFESDEMQCEKHKCGCQPTDTCDDFEEGTEDEEQGAEMSGEY